VQKQRIHFTGRRASILLSPHLLRQIGVGEGGVVEVRLSDDASHLEVVPVSGPILSAEAKRFAARVDAFIERHRRTLERLAR
jgi:hypothetical protein